MLAAYQKRRADLLPGVFTTARPASASWLTITSADGQAARRRFDSAKDFYELTQIKIEQPETGLFMIGGGVPKNFAQDIVVAADILGQDEGKRVSRCTSTPSRSPSPTSATAPVQLARSRKLELGQGRHRLRTDGLQRSHARRAADRRLRLSQAGLEGPQREEIRCAYSPMAAK